MAGESKLPRVIGLSFPIAQADCLRLSWTNGRTPIERQRVIGLVTAREAETPVVTDNGDGTETVLVRDRTLIAPKWQCSPSFGRENHGW
jgi:hypothetical protein